MAAHLFNENGQIHAEVVNEDIPDIFDVLDTGEDDSAVKYLLGFGPNVVDVVDSSGGLGHAQIIDFSSLTPQQQLALTSATAGGNAGASPQLATVSVSGAGQANNCTTAALQVNSAGNILNGGNIVTLISGGSGHQAAHLPASNILPIASHHQQSQPSQLQSFVGSPLNNNSSLILTGNHVVTPSLVSGLARENGLISGGITGTGRATSLQQLIGVAGPSNNASDMASISTSSGPDLISTSSLGAIGQQLKISNVNVNNNNTMNLSGHPTLVTPSNLTQLLQQQQPVPFMSIASALGRSTPSSQTISAHQTSHVSPLLISSPMSSTTNCSLSSSSVPVDVSGQQQHQQLILSHGSAIGSVPTVQWTTANPQLPLVTSLISSGNSPPNGTLAHPSPVVSSSVMSTLLSHINKSPPTSSAAAATTTTILADGSISNTTANDMPICSTTMPRTSSLLASIIKSGQVVSTNNGRHGGISLMSPSSAAQTPLVSASQPALPTVPAEIGEICDANKSGCKLLPNPDSDCTVTTVTPSGDLKTTYACWSCSKEFTTKFNLKRHINLHCNKSKIAGVPVQGPPSANMPTKKPSQKRRAAMLESAAMKAAKITSMTECPLGSVATTVAGNQQAGVATDPSMLVGPSTLLLSNVTSDQFLIGQLANGGSAAATGSLADISTSRLVNGTSTALSDLGSSLALITDSNGQTSLVPASALLSAQSLPILSGSQTLTTSLTDSQSAVQIMSPAAPPPAHISVAGGGGLSSLSPPMTAVKSRQRRVRRSATTSSSIPASSSSSVDPAAVMTSIASVVQSSSYNNNNCAHLSSVKDVNSCVSSPGSLASAVSLGTGSGGESYILLTSPPGSTNGSSQTSTGLGSSTIQINGQPHVLLLSPPSPQQSTQQIQLASAAGNVDAAGGTTVVLTDGSSTESQNGNSLANLLPRSVIQALSRVMSDGGSGGGAGALHSGTSSQENSTTSSLSPNSMLASAIKREVLLTSTDDHLINLSNSTIAQTDRLSQETATVDGCVNVDVASFKAQLPASISLLLNKPTSIVMTSDCQSSPHEVNLVSSAITTLSTKEESSYLDDDSDMSSIACLQPVNFSQQQPDVQQQQIHSSRSQTPTSRPALSAAELEVRSSSSASSGGAHLSTDGNESSTSCVTQLPVGWKRKTVKISKDESCVYYYSHDGQKFSSITEIQDYFASRGMTVDAGVFGFVAAAASTTEDDSNMGIAAETTEKMTGINGCVSNTTNYLHHSYSRCPFDGGEERLANGETEAVDSPRDVGSGGEALSDGGGGNVLDFEANDPGVGFHNNVATSSDSGASVDGSCHSSSSNTTPGRSSSPSHSSHTTSVSIDNEFHLKTSQRDMMNVTSTANATTFVT